MEEAAAVHAARKRHASNGNSDGDLISRLPDAVLGTIISLIPTKDGARTQSISRRWRHLWRFAPLNIEAGIGLCHDVLERASIVSRILSDHPGPARRFYFPFVSLGDDGYAVIDGWFRSPALANLQELDISYDHWRPGYPLPPSALRSASATLLTAKFGYWGFPEIAPPLSFPLLRQLTLWSVCISPNAFHGVISGCHALESLLMWEIHIVGPLHVSSATLRSIGFSCARYSRNQELVIEEAPRLKVLLSLHAETFGETIRVIMAPKLEILGPLSPLISKFEIATLVFQEMVPVSLTDSIPTVKVLAVSTSGQLNAVLDVLRCFPCLEKLYVIWHKYLGKDMNNMHRHEYDPLDHIECLESHLKKIVFKNYEGCGQDVGFAKFFLLNAKVLKEMEFGVPKNYNNKWVAVQHTLLQVENRASRDVQFKFRRGFTNSGTHLDIHDLSMVDPFDCMFC